MPQLQGVRVLAVVVYAEPLTTRQRRASAADAVSSAFPWGKQNGVFFEGRISSMGDIAEGSSKGLIPLVRFIIASPFCLRSIRVRPSYGAR
jgi:hypothetical protein